ncbi:APOBEC1 complementation factor [Zootermopsis nevadensis]|uniref:APOBEC1 complementation factor n=2 Tax=Zootermopsis nevadensis TaxID=136037 RepID=A0A067R2P8_ZOONE|nr:APOBEC1 complementation factor [Zootermopsis nevadensis]
MESVQGPECLERVKKLRDFAFVHFSDRDSAKAAMEYWDKKELDGSVVEITWAKPVNRNPQHQLKHVSHGGYPQTQYVLPPGMGPAASFHTPFMKAYNDCGTQGSPHVQSSSSWRGGRMYVAAPSSVIGSKFGNRAPEVLSEYCQKNNWGEPFYNLMAIPSVQEDKQYMCQVTIPQHPGGQLQFQTPKVSSSAEGAKVLAAEITLSHMSAAAAFAEGYSHTSVVQAGHLVPQPPAATYPTGSGLQTQPELTIAYALPPNQPSGYLVHGKVTGYDTQFYDSQYPVQM